jgi:hypothetical protein
VTRMVPVVPSREPGCRGIILAHVAHPSREFVVTIRLGRARLPGAALVARS